MEFAGPPENFDDALSAVGRHYGLARLRINLTNDDLPDMIESRSPKEAGPAYFRLFRSHGMAPERAPDTCWLDQIVALAPRESERRQQVQIVALAPRESERRQ